MEQIKRVIFAAGNGTSRAPMAAVILRDMVGTEDLEVLARGIVVQFPEPMNQKAEAILVSHGLGWEDYAAEQLAEEDITENTLIFTMEEHQRQRIIMDWERANEKNTFVLSNFVGDELEILNPYGTPLQSYGLCYEVLRKTIEKLLVKLQETYLMGEGR